MQPKEYGIVVFDTQPHGAKIYVDGQLLVDPDMEESLKTPARVLLIEGRRDFTFVLEGHEDLSGYVDVFEGVTINIFRNMKPGKSQEGWGEPQPQISLDSLTSTPQQQIFLTGPNTGILRIYSFPDGADTYVNGRYVGKSPLVVTDVPAGVATVTWKMPGMMVEEKIVDIVEGAWSETYATMREVLPKLYNQYDYQYIYQYDYDNNYDYQYVSDQYYQNREKIMNENMNLQSDSTIYGSGSVYISSYPTGATICIDGIIITDQMGNPAITPATVALPVGDHEIILELEGYINYYEDIYIYYPGERLDVSINLSQKAVNISNFGSMGNVTITSYPTGATICIDGSAVIDGLGNSVKTPATIALLEGYHDITLYLDGYFDGYEYIYIYPGAELNIPINLSQKILTTLSPLPDYIPEYAELPYYRPIKPSYTQVKPTSRYMPEYLSNDSNCFTDTEGIVVITSYPAGATIVMDGKTVIDMDTGAPLTTPVTLAVEMGYHDFQFKLDGYFDEFSGIYAMPRYHQYIHRNFNVC